MTDRRALYLIAPPGRWRDDAEVALASTPDRVFDGAADFLPLEVREAGVVILHAGELPLEDLARVVVACLEAGPSWIPALVPPDGAGDVAVPLGPGYRYPLAELARVAQPGGGDALLVLPEVVERVRVARHDINNPLAAALAEAQLLRMDAHEEDLVEALDAILEQLRRIKDLVASLHGVRPPSRSRAEAMPTWPVEDVSS